MQNSAFLGVTVLGDFILSEGIAPVLENLQRIGATAVACNPTVTAAAPEGEGSFQPPDDAGSSPRRFDRPLFGKPALWVKSGPSFRPNPKYYANSAYGPRKPNALTDEHGSLIGEFVQAALQRGMKVYFQLGAAQPSGLRDEDRPWLPSGKIPAKRMADTASLASPAVRAYNHAYVRDLLAAYPDIAGFRIDWPEYPCYTWGEIFQDFSPHVAEFSASAGFDFETIRQSLQAMYQIVTEGRLRPEFLRNLACRDWETFQFPNFLLNAAPQLTSWLQLKAALSGTHIEQWREIVEDAGRGEKELSSNAFMPPYTLLTGLDFAAAARHSHAVSPKLYTMHWPLMVKFWADEILAANPHVDEHELVSALVNLMDLADPGTGGNSLDDYGYPQPDEPHPIPDAPQLRKLRQARLAVDGRAAFTPLVHGYGPPDDFARRFELVTGTDIDGIWINRYGYLSDEKLDAIERIWRGRQC